MTRTFLLHLCWESWICLIVSELAGNLLRHDGTCKVGLAKVEERDVGKEADANDETI